MGKYDTTRYNHNLNRATFDVEGMFDAIDKGMREGAQRWLDDHPRRRRRRS